MTDRKSNGHAGGSEPQSPSRRRFLGGAGITGGVLAASGLAGPAMAAAGGNVASAPESLSIHQSRAFYGWYQPGIVTPRPAAGMVASFDVLAREREDLQRLFAILTERAAFLMKGGRPPQLDPRFPPSDSGILGPEVTPDNLTMTVSLGASLFDGRFGLAPAKPRHLQRMARFPNDALDAGLCHGDISIQFCANTLDTVIHALRDILKTTPDLLMLRWKQEGTVPVLEPKPGQPAESARNFFGFRDGSANPDSGHAGLMERVVWVGKAHGEPEWALGGSYQVVRIIRNFVERWDRTPLREQERIIGRAKDSGAPFDGRTEQDVPDFAADPEGRVTSLDAHIRLASPHGSRHEAGMILRRPFNYSSGVTKSGQLEMGLLFIAYQADLEAGFITIQKRLAGEPLEEYIKPIGGGFFFSLPGVRDAGDYYGRALIDATA